MATRLARIRRAKVLAYQDIFFPERVEEDPPLIADSWSETLTPAEGTWIVTTAEAYVILDTINVEVRLSSINLYTPEGESVYWIGVALQFNMPVDLSKFLFIQFNIAALNRDPDTPNLSGLAWFRLFDSNGGSASIDFGTLTTGEWQTKRIYLADLEPGYEGFDPTRVTMAEWGFDCINVNPYTWPGADVWLDAGPFFYRQALRPTLRIESSPSGKLFEIDGLSSITPATFTLDVDVEYTVSIDPAGFLQWEDGSTNPVRNITLGEGEEKTITAYYEEAPPPEEGVVLPEWVPIVFVMGSLIFLGVLIVKM